MSESAHGGAAALAQRPAPASQEAPTAARGSAAPAAATGAAADGRARRIVLSLAALGIVAINIAGAPYYLAPLSVRVRHPLHAWLRPSGYVGQALGLLAAALFLFLWLYPLRKKYASRLAFTGKINAWLDWHVAAGLLVPWLAATHAGWRFTELIGLGYAALFVVYLSGLVGRYLYARIPRRRDGLELSRDEIGSERERLLFEFTATSGLPPDVVRSSLAGEIGSCQGLGLLGTVRRMLADDLQRRRAARAIAREISRRWKETRQPDRTMLRTVLRLARREMALAQHVRMLDATRRALRFWHAAHKPVAITALLAVLAHIVVAVVMGATWFY